MRGAMAEVAYVNRVQIAWIGVAADVADVGLVEPALVPDEVAVHRQVLLRLLWRGLFLNSLAFRLWHRPACLFPVSY